MSRIKNARGQGSVEYVLILALAVAIVLGAIYQLNSAFKVFANNYFGEYLACLLETGELPALGGVAEGICAAEFKAFSLADGSPKVGEPVGSGGGAGGGGEPSPSDMKNVSGRGGAGNVTVAEGSGSAMSGANSRRGTRTRVRRGGRGGGDDDGSAGGGSSTAPSAFADGYDSNRGVRSPIRYPAGYNGRRRAAMDEDENKRTKVTTTTASGSRREDEAKIFKVRAPATISDAADDKIDFSIGNMLRYLIVIVIIIAIVIFIGGQALQVSKST